MTAYTYYGIPLILLGLILIPPIYNRFTNKYIRFWIIYVIGFILLFLIGLTIYKSAKSAQNDTNDPNFNKPLTVKENVAVNCIQKKYSDDIKYFVVKKKDDNDNSVYLCELELRFYTKEKFSENASDAKAYAIANEYYYAIYDNDFFKFIRLTFILEDSLTKKITAGMSKTIEIPVKELTGKTTLKFYTKDSLTFYEDYFDNGMIAVKGSLNDSVEHGYYTLWHNNGVKAKEGKMTLGKQDSIWNYWDESGNLIKTKEFKTK